MKILAGIDGSSAAQAALDLVSRMEWPEGSSLRIVEVVETTPELYHAWPPVAIAPTDDLEATLLNAAEATLVAVARRFRGSPLRVETEVVRGRPAEALLANARRVGADLIVVGSRGHGTLEAMLLGSVSAEIVSRSHVPVFVVRGDTAQRVVLAWDGSPAADAAVQLVESWPALRRAEVRVAEVVDAGPWWATVPPIVPAEVVTLFEQAADVAFRDANTAVRALAARLRADGIRADEAVLEGDAGAAIIQLARESNADLVVVGTHARHGVAGAVLGSVARALTLHSPTSVLVVPLPVAAAAASTEPRHAAAAR